MVQQQTEGTAPNSRVVAVEDEQAWFGGCGWQEGEREASKEIRKGRLSPKFHSMYEIRKYLSEA